jgi:hypothetical protein
MKPHSGLLRGSAVGETASSLHNFLTVLVDRNLQDDSSSPPSSKEGSRSFTMLLSVIVGLILIFYVICTYQIMRMWLCKVCCRSEREEEAVVEVFDHNGRLFNLSGNQRRAVLEAIFSETSKVRRGQCLTG